MMVGKAVLLADCPHERSEGFAVCRRWYGFPPSVHHSDPWSL